MVGLFLAYKMGRLLVDGRVSAAYSDADLVWHVERALRLPDEADVQHLLLNAEALIRAANIYYAVVHFPATVAFLLFMYFFRPDHYLRFRRMLAWLTAMGLVIHFAFPLAPPRMLDAIGLIDTAAVYGPSVYGPPQTDTLSNQYAAMPSLHVGWAIVVTAGLIVATRSRWRWLWAAHPVLTMIVVVGTANHYWIDGVVAGVLVAGLLAATAGTATARDAAMDGLPTDGLAMDGAATDAVTLRGTALDDAVPAGAIAAPPVEVSTVPPQLPHGVAPHTAGKPT